MDTEGVIAELYDVTSIPQVLVIGKDGKVATHFFGTKTEGELRAALEKVGFRSGPARPASVAAAASPVVPPKPAAAREVSGMISVMMPAPPEVDISKLNVASTTARAVTEVQPAYPPLAKAARASGPVHVMVVISEEGKVTDSSVSAGIRCSARRHCWQPGNGSSNR